MQVLFLILMFVIGSVFGSFFCCQVRRQVESARCLSRATRPEKRHECSLPKRSICLHCKKQLKWYDNIPIISWLILRGKCRNCHKKIGYAEIISEIASGLALLLIATTIDVGITTPAGWAEFILITIFTLSLLFLAIYDGITGKLPVPALAISFICAILPLALRLINNLLGAGFFDFQALMSGISMPLLSGLLFGGIYLALYLISKGKWVGDGDWILAGVIGLALGHPWLSMIALFVANFSACLIMYPLVKNRKNHQIYFGPFLVLSFVVVYAFSDFAMSMI